MKLDPHKFAALMLVIEDLAEGKLDARFALSHERDGIDAIGYAINVLAEELQETIVSLQRANEELTQFAYAASHDLKAPLRAIRSCADVLQEELQESLPEQLRGYLNALGEAADRGQHLVDDLLEFTRVSQAGDALAMVDLGVLLRRLLSGMEIAPATEVIMPDAWPALHLDEPVVAQLFENLLSNALKYNTSAAPRLELGWCEVAGDRCEVFVRDNGIGIEPRYHEQIFGLFQRLHRRNTFEGTGLGLAIAKRAAERLGATIRLESALGEGSTFFVSLPKAQQGRFR